jgi:hypothetical protein
MKKKILEKYHQSKKIIIIKIPSFSKIKMGNKISKRMKIKNPMLRNRIIKMAV